MLPLCSYSPAPGCDTEEGGCCSLSSVCTVRASSAESTEPNGSALVLRRGSSLSSGFMFCSSAAVVDGKPTAVLALPPAGVAVVVVTLVVVVVLVVADAALAG